jgi:hypothetical protein
LIEYHPGHITVLDRPGLEARTCECYAVVKKEFDRLLPEEVALYFAPAQVVGCAASASACGSIVVRLAGKRYLLPRCRRRRE